MDEDHVTHEYLLDITEKLINSVIYDLGTVFDRINSGSGSATLYSDRWIQQPKEVSNTVYKFLLNIEFIDGADNYLTEKGKAYFELLFVHQDVLTANENMKQALLENPVVNLIGQVFFGRGKISIDQLRILLNYHSIADFEIQYQEVTSLLTLLNKFNILVYDKKNKSFYFKEQISTDAPIRQYYVNPSTPFSNVCNARKIIKACAGDIYWIDKHFRKEGLEIILDGLAFEGVNSVTIISSTDNITQSARSDYEALKFELNERSIELSWRVITDSAFKWHDRWIVADNICYNIPPVLAIIRGQRADILKTDTPLDIEPFLNASNLI